MEKRYMIDVEQKAEKLHDRLFNSPLYDRYTPPEELERVMKNEAQSFLRSYRDEVIEEIAAEYSSDKYRETYDAGMIIDRIRSLKSTPEVKA